MLEVNSEISKLKKILIHYPGEEIDNMLPSKIHPWLLDDILDLEMLREEYNVFNKLLLAFLDPAKYLVNKNLNPLHKDYQHSENVIELRYLLADLFSNQENENKTLALIEQIAALEKIHFKRKLELIELYDRAKDEYTKNKDLFSNLYSFISLANTLISGKMHWWYSKKDQKVKEGNWEFTKYAPPLFIFKPIPNLMFTRDIGVVLDKNLLITKTFKEIRHREILIIRYIAECFFYKNNATPTAAFNLTDNKVAYTNRILDNVIEISEDDDHFQYEENEMENKMVNFEGGDIMMVSKRHLLIGKSQRTSSYAINKLIHRIFRQNLNIEIISVIQIDPKRSQMHIDTILTQVKENVWMLYGRLSKSVMDEENTIENSPYSHREIIENKEINLNLKKYEYVSILQFYCPKGEYYDNDGDFTENDFYLYNYHELKQQGYSEIEINGFNDGIGIPRNRLYDGKTITQKKMTYEFLSKKCRNGGNSYTKPLDLESLLRDISVMEYKNINPNDVKFIYSGNKKYPYDEREQWTDGCNLLTLGNGVALGYDRNRKTAECFNSIMQEINSKEFPVSNKKLYDYFKNKGILENNSSSQHLHIIQANDFLEYINVELNKPEEIVEFIANLKDLLILMPSSEISRARGGSHCLSMPLIRD